jgi:hypothetical protein
MSEKLDREKDFSIRRSRQSFEEGLWMEMMNIYPNP